jgi:hypothetical protein
MWHPCRAREVLALLLMFLASLSAQGPDKGQKTCIFPDEQGLTDPGYMDCVVRNHKSPHSP